jgi:lauroyl/myristoyl acyltransferase
VFSLAILLDVLYQVIVFRWVYPLESVVVAIILAFLPYLFLRGLVNRIARAWIHPQGNSSS